jgi:hypothetical protein
LSPRTASATRLVQVQAPNKPKRGTPGFGRGFFFCPILIDMRVLLVANNPKANVPSSGYDLYVHFNSAIHWGKTPEDKSIIGVRKNSENNKHRNFHYTKDLNLKPYYLDVPDEKIVAIGWTKDIRPLHPDIPIIGVEEVEDYPVGHSATSGYAALHYYLNRGHQVTLCGFNLPEASYYKITKLHLPDFETGKIQTMIDRGLIDRHN